jgi:hypothetical protein
LNGIVEDRVRDRGNARCSADAPTFRGYRQQDRRNWRFTMKWCEPEAVEAMANDQTRIDRIQQYLRQMPQQARRNLLVEIERMQIYGEDMPCSDVILAELRTEFRNSGQSQDRVGNPSRHFFRPIEILFVDRAPELANSGQISRGCLAAIWEWINKSLLPTLAQEYCDEMKTVLVMDNAREARRIAAGFRCKVAKCLESTLASEELIERTRVGLAQYTASRGAIDDLKKIISALLIADAIVAFNQALPASIDNLDVRTLAAVRTPLDAFAAKYPHAVPFALTIVAKHLKTSWQLIRLATKMAPGRRVPQIASTRYAASVSMVLDHLDDKRLGLRRALKSSRVAVAKDILTEIYAIEEALQVRIEGLEASEWGRRLDGLMAAVAADLQIEFQGLPEGAHHVLGSCKRHPHESAQGMLTSLRGMLGLGHRPGG